MLARLWLICGMEDSKATFAEHGPVAPPGAWFRQDSDGWQVGVYTRSPLGAATYAILSIGWMAFIAYFYIGMQKQLGHFSWPNLVVATLFSLIELLLWSRLAIYCAGRVILTVTGDNGRFFIGVASLGLSRKFKWSEIEGIEIQQVKGDAGEPSGRFLVLVGKSRIPLSDAIDTSFHEYFVEVIRGKIAARSANRERN